MVTHKEMPDDFVYEFTKEIFKNKPLLVSVHKSATEVEPKNILYSPIPLHPGAIKYYEEIGDKDTERTPAVILTAISLILK